MLRHFLPYDEEHDEKGVRCVATSDDSQRLATGYSKGTVKISLRDIFYTNKVSGNINFQNTQAYFRNVRDTRQVSFSFSYRFGKPIKGLPQRRNGGAGDEQNRVKMGNNG